MNGALMSATTFDEPILYKGIYLYPITIKHYTIFKQVAEILTLNQMSEKDISLLGLPYLEYIYRKSESDESCYYSQMLLDVLRMCTKVNNITFSENEQGDIFINFLKPSSDYDELLGGYQELYQRYMECVNTDPLSEVGFALARQLMELREQMFDTYTFNATEFDELRHVICVQNDIDETLLDPEWEETLKEARKLIAKADHTGGLEFRDLLIALSYDLKKTPDELVNMSITTFDRYVEIMLRKESYGIAKSAEANGAKFKKPIEHWLRHYEPKGKYSDVVVDRADSFIEDLNE